jgi:hypothetical protein
VPLSASLQLFFSSPRLLYLLALPRRTATPSPSIEAGLSSCSLQTLYASDSAYNALSNWDSNWGSRGPVDGPRTAAYDATFNRLILNNPQGSNNLLLFDASGPEAKGAEKLPKRTGDTSTGGFYSVSKLFQYDTSSSAFYACADNGYGTSAPCYKLNITKDNPDPVIDQTYANLPTRGQTIAVLPDQSMFYVALYDMHCIFQVPLGSSPASPSLFTGKKGTSGYANGHVSVATFTGPTGLALLDDAYLYVVSFGGNDLRVIDLKAGQVNLAAGSAVGAPGFSDGLGPAASFLQPFGLLLIRLLSGQYVLLVPEYGNCAVRAVTMSSPTGPFSVQTIAGKGPGFCKSLDSAAALTGSLTNPVGIAQDETAGGRIFLLEYGVASIRVLTCNGVAASGQSA